MQDRISLIYKDGMTRPINAAVSEAIYDLNIDRMAEYACSDRRSTDYFLSVLSALPETPSDASYRSEILSDLIRYPKLLSTLTQIFRSYDNLRSETDEMTKEIFRYGMPVGDSGMLDCTYEELYINAHFARNVIACFSEIGEAFSEFEVNSEGLLKMKDFCTSIKDSKCIEEVERAAERFKSESPDNYIFTVDCDLGESMCAISSVISEMTDTAQKEKAPILSIFKKKPARKEINIGSSAADTAINTVSAALSELSSLFSDIAGGIYSVFYGIGEELRFYTVACEIAKKLTEAGMRYVFPTVKEKEALCLEAHGIYDLLLLSEGKDHNDIITNDILCDKRGILAMGDNNCGKTSFLRAVGCAVLFAQNGLFVCADEMTVSIRNGIFTHFSSAEKDFTIGDAAGRFEGEVIDIAKIIDSLTPYSLVLLNESFQTTAYREGAEGMKAILDVLPRINVTYIFVTHITAMTKLFKKGEVRLLGAEGFRLTEKEILKNK